MMKQSLFQIGEEVSTALDEGRAVVALESTVIAHGLPRPQNLETGRTLERLVREAGAVPATVAVLDGKFCVGLTDAQLERIATSNNVQKLSRRDLPVAVAHKLDGATTVATTMWAAARARLKVFATGGIGGVHRGALPDVSADLPELAHNTLVVVCSGAKVVLDLEATREWLETWGVTVVGYECSEMPAFYTRRSNLLVDVRADSAAEVASLARARMELGLEGALLVTVPVPAEFEVDERLLREALEDALAEAEGARVKGRELTPFLLTQLSRHTEGLTLRANIALLENNARTAAEIAKALAER